VKADRPQVGEEAQLLADREQALFGADLGLGVVPLGPPHGSQQDRVGFAAERDRLRGQRGAAAVDGDPADQGFSRLELVPALAGDCLQHLDPFGHDLGTDPVSRQHGDLGLHWSPHSTGQCRASMGRSADVAIVGGGIVGLATAHALLAKAPGTRVVLFEKEKRLAAHQTGHNSGVIHSGLYYTPGSRKARNCRRGKMLLEAFCREHGVAFETCGKVVVAVSKDEVPRLQALEARARANGVGAHLVGRERLCELEPHVHGLQALHVPETGIVDYGAVCDRLAALVRERGGEIVLGGQVHGLQAQGGRVRLETSQGEAEARVAVNCAGLHSDRVLLASGQKRPARIVPFRGEYYELRAEARGLVQNLIYPVPDPGFPFLGVHFTRTIHGGVECGPNAVLALAREGYRWSDVSPRDLVDVAGYRGFWRLAGRHWRMGAGEVRRSLSKAAFTRALQRLLPELSADDLRPAPAGVRAQALGPDGALVDDFLIQEAPGMVHVLNAPSPAATSSLAIGEEVGDRALLQIGGEGRGAPLTS
jgi:L-2-hydroxyglutarate oxidase